MKNFLIMALFVLPAFTVMGISDVYATEKNNAELRIEMLDDVVMEQLARQSASPKNNQVLSALEGTWRYDLKYWSSKEADPQLSTGRAENEMILDNRFFSSKTNLILYIGGQAIPYEGWNIIGYDTTKKAFTSVLLDTMRIGMMAGTAQYNEENETLEEEGQFRHPLTGEKRSYRSTLEFSDFARHKRTFYMMDQSGQEFKVLEIEFHREN